MVKLDGINVQRPVRSITINGAYISATINNQPVDIRHIDGADWYDTKHAAVMKALEVLELALIDLTKE